MTPHPHTVQDDRIGYVFKKVHAALRIAMDDCLRPLGISTPQYAVLSVVGEEAGLSGAEVARRCFVTPQTANELMVNLEQHGFLRRQRAEDSRALQLSLTEEGTILIGQANARVAEVEARLIHYLPIAEQAQLLQLLQACVRGLTER